MSKIVWALFGNDEDGVYGSGTHYNPDGEETPWKAIGWWFRNPAHNFTHHVIGIYGKVFASKVAWQKGGWKKTIRVYGLKHLPYWEYQGGGIQFYLGWRKSGAFGIALRRRG